MHATPDFITLDDRVAWPSQYAANVRAADGSLLDVTLLAAVAALSSLRLPAVRVNEDGNVVPADQAGIGSGDAETDAVPMEASNSPADRCSLPEHVPADVSAPPAMLLQTIGIMWLCADQTVR